MNIEFLQGGEGRFDKWVEQRRFLHPGMSSLDTHTTIQNVFVVLATVLADGALLYSSPFVDF